MKTGFALATGLAGAISLVSLLSCSAFASDGLRPETQQRLTGYWNAILANRLVPQTSAPVQIARATIDRPVGKAPQEEGSRKALDAAIAPVLNLNVSPGDLAALKAAVTFVKKGDAIGAQMKASEISDPVVGKLLRWYQLRAGQAHADDYAQWLKDNPAWPERWRMRERLEEDLFDEAKPARDVIKHFAERSPETGAGWAALASAYLAAGDKDNARKFASKAWRDYSFTNKREKSFLSRLGSLLNANDHKWRIDKRLLSDIRWRRNRNARIAYVRKLLPLISKSERAKRYAQIAVYNRSSRAAGLINALPAAAKTDPVMLYFRAQRFRRKGELQSAAKMLMSAPLATEKIVSPDDWWVERRVTAYQALDKGQPALAYKLVAKAGDLTVNPLKEQQFLAGWLAMRYLNNTDQALKHFEAMVAAADGPLSRAKSNYWLGRALEELGRKGEAIEAYARAAKQIDTFHGHLAMLKLRPDNRLLDIRPPAAPSADEKQRFTSLDAVRALVIAKKANMGRAVTRPFVAHLRTYLGNEASVAMIVHLAQALGDTQIALRTAKRAIANGQNLIYYAYPVRAFPAYKPLRTPPETAFLLGVARQETEFNTTIKSGAGARGILQVMPITARHVCRDYKLKCNIRRLQNDEAYNTKIASAYIADRMQEFSGSYVLGLAGYNAGPGRTRQWIRKFGDPRDGRIDPIDWIERIPFKETRNYVAKVLSNIQVYRARLGNTENALRTDLDLRRAQADTPSGVVQRAPGHVRLGSGG